MNKHAKIGASSMARQLRCTGSINLIERLGLTSSSSEYAEAGTKFAESMEGLLKKELLLNDLPVDHQDAAVAFLDWMDCNTSENQDMYVEERIGDENFGGTPDLIIVDHGYRVVYVIDFKWGVIPVSAYKNMQLATYLKLFKDTGEFPVQKLLVDRPYTIKFVIFQPNNFSTDEQFDMWVVDDDWNRKFNEDVEKLVANELPVYFSEGEHCRFCPAAESACPLKRDTVDRGLTTIGAPMTPAVSELTDEQLSFLVEHGSLLKKFIDDAEKHSWKRLTSGNSVSGLKLVKTFGNRKWKGGATEEVEKQLGDDAYKMSIISPAQAEKLGMDVTDLVDRPERTKVVLNSDNRQGIEVSTVETSDFKSVGE